MKGYHIKMEGEEVNIFLMKILTESALKYQEMLYYFIIFFLERKNLKKVSKKAMCGT